MKRRLTLITLCIVMVLTAFNNVWGAATTNSKEDRSSVVAVKPKPILSKEQAIEEVAEEKDTTVSDVIEPLHIQFDKQKFVDVMNSIVIGNSFDMYSFYLVDLNFDGIPELIAQYLSSMGGSFNIYDIYDLADKNDAQLGYNYVSSDIGTVEFTHYINTDTNTPVCIADEYWRDYENDYMIRDISELLLTDGEISANTEHGLSKKTIFLIKSNWFTEDRSNEDIIEFYVNTDITNAKTIEEYYSSKHDITLPRSESFYLFKNRDNVIKKLIDSYIESCETTAKIENEWFVFDIVND